MAVVVVVLVVVMVMAWVGFSVRAAAPCRTRTTHPDPFAGVATAPAIAGENVLAESTVARSRCCTTSSLCPPLRKTRFAGYECNSLGRVAAGSPRRNFGLFNREPTSGEPSRPLALSPAIFFSLLFFTPPQHLRIEHCRAT